MKITKFGHSCLLIEEGGLRALTDPGSWNALPDVGGLDCVLITHEHGDHLDVDQLKAVLERNPQAKVISHTSVGNILTAAGIEHSVISNGETISIKGVQIESFGTKHACFYGDMPNIQNTGYLIAERLFVTGDALHDIPTKPVEILALPCGGPWMRLSEAIDYARRLNPKVIFPVHDAMYIEKYRNTVIPTVIGKMLEGTDIQFREMLVGSAGEF